MVKRGGDFLVVEMQPSAVGGVCFGSGSVFFVYKNEKGHETRNKQFLLMRNENPEKSLSGKCKKK